MGGCMKSKFHTNTTKCFSFSAEKLKYYAYEIQHMLQQDFTVILHISIIQKA